MDIKYTQNGPKVTIIDIPEIGVENYYVWRLDDQEDDFHFHQRAMAHAYEIIRRHNAGEPYFVGYRHVPQDDRLHMTIRKIVGGTRRFEKIMGIQDEFVEVIP